MSYLTQIILKQGLGHPGNVLVIAEPAYDSSNNLLYVGNGIGNTPTLIGPITVDVTKEYVDGSLATKTSFEYVDGSLSALSGIYTTFEYVDGSLAAIQQGVPINYDLSVNTLVVLGETGDQDQTCIIQLGHDVGNYGAGAAPDGSVYYGFVFPAFEVPTGGDIRLGFDNNGHLCLTGIDYLSNRYIPNVEQTETIVDGQLVLWNNPDGFLGQKSIALDQSLTIADGSLGVTFSAPDVTKEYVDGSLATKATYEYVDGSLAAIPVPDVTKEYVDGSLATKFTLNVDNGTSFASATNTALQTRFEIDVKDTSIITYIDLVTNSGIEFTQDDYANGKSTSVYIDSNAFYVDPDPQSIETPSNHGITIDDTQNLVNTLPWTYAIDMSSLMVDRTLVDKGYVDSKYSTIEFVNDVSAYAHSLVPEIDQFQFITADYLLPAPTGSGIRYVVKNLFANDVSVYCAPEYQIDYRSDRVLLSMNTMDLYDYDASNWFIV